MPHGGDYLVPQRENTNVSADVDVAAADTSKAAVVAVRGASFVVFVQKITVSVITDAAQSLIFQSSGGTKIIGKTKASPGLGPIVFDFGPNGTALLAGENLDIATSGAGIAARVHVEAFQRQASGVATNLTTANTAN